MFLFPKPPPLYKMSSPSCIQNQKRREKSFAYTQTNSTPFYVALVTQGEKLWYARRDVKVNLDIMTKNWQHKKGSYRQYKEFKLSDRLLAFQ
jgi:hypothetical protein